MRIKKICEKCGEPASIREFKGEWIEYEECCRKCGSKNILKFE